MKTSYLVLKRFFAIFVVLFLLPSLCFSAEVSKELAQQVAENYITHYVTNYGNWKGLDHPPTIIDYELVEYKNTPVAYNFRVDPSGHILVAYWDEFSPVLLYSTTSDFIPSRIEESCSIESWIIPEIYDTYNIIKENRAEIDKKTSYIETRVAKAWEWLGEKTIDFSPKTEGYGYKFATVGPLLTTTWAQGSPYNQYCPGISGSCDHCIVGCVATAWSQLMKYWNWPDRGTGSHSYLWTNGGQTLSANFDHEYYWSDMPNQLTGSSTSAQKDAVARLCSDVGISADMNYSCSSSGSNAWANDVLDVYFKYKSSMQKISRGSYTATQWFNFFKAEFDASPARPIIFSIFGSCGGHETVADGYQTGATDKVHVNLGWSGSYDGFYDVTNNFTTGSCTWQASSQVIVTHIEPEGGGGTPEITSPVEGSTLSCESQTFQWTDNDTPVTEWWLYLGSSQGANDYYDSGSLGTSTSHTVTRCWPDDSSTVWARLWYKTGGSWESEDFQYTAPTNCQWPSPPEITGPTPGSTLSCNSDTFQWTDNGTPVTEWWLYLGSSQGAKNYYNSDSLGTSTSHTVTRCWPDDSSTVWARLWYKTGGSWESMDSSYTAPTGCPGPSPPEITSPTPDSTLSCDSETFQWTDNGTPVTEWWLYLGPSQGAYNYYNSGSLGTSTSHTVTRCWPDDSSTVWARLWYKTGGSWESEDFQYTAPTGCTAGGFNSQFNGDASGWEVHYGTWWIASNQWYTTYGDPNYWASVSYDGNFDDFDYQARLWRNGSDIHSNSILIRGTPTPLDVDKGWYSCCVFQYTRDGYYSVWKTVDSTSTWLQNWTYSSTINQGGAWNTLRVVASGSNLYYYINETQVWSGSDSSLTSGRVGIEMYSEGTSGDQLWVDWATLTAVTSAITDEVSEEQKALNEEANERGGGSKEASSSVY